MVVNSLRHRLPVLPLTVAATHFSLEFLANILPVVYPLLIAQYGFTYSQIGTIALIGGLCGSITQLGFGALVDRWDARKQVILSIAWMGLGMGLVGYVSNFGWLVVVVGFAKLSSAAYHPAGAALANFASSKMKGTSLSYFSVGGSIGSAMCPIMIGFALGNWGLNGTVILIPCGIFLALLLWSPLGRIPIIKSSTKEKKARGRAGPIFALLPVIILVGTRSWTAGTFTTYLPEWYGSQGASLTMAGSVFSLMLVMNSVGNLSGGRLADRIGNEKVIVVGMVAMSLFLWGFLNLDGAIQLVALALFGVANGATTPPSLVMAQNAWPEAIGLASSLVMGVGWMPSSIGSGVVGAIADRTSLTYALSTLTYVPLLGAAVLLVAVLYNRRSA